MDLFVYWLLRFKSEVLSFGYSLWSCKLREEVALTEKLMTPQAQMITAYRLQGCHPTKHTLFNHLFYSWALEGYSKGSITVYIQNEHCVYSIRFETGYWDHKKNYKSTKVLNLKT